jgi:hypothetical protein
VTVATTLERLAAEGDLDAARQVSRELDAALTRLIPAVLQMIAELQTV